MPIDVAAPADRITYMINNAEAHIVIKDENLSEVYPEDIVTLNLQNIIKQKGTFSHGLYELDIPTYVIYTSGSTGTPKGVIVNNRNIVNEIYWHIDEAKLDENTIFCSKYGFYF